MPAEVIIRPAHAGEADVLGRIGFNAWNDGEHGALDAGRADKAKLLGEFVRFCRTKHGTVLVAERDGEPLGWSAREHGDSYVSDLWVAPLAQGQGVGARLLAALELAIAKAGYHSVSLETRAGATRAIRFYERHGYRIVWRKEKPTPALGYSIDKLGFEKPLTGTSS